MKFQNPVQPLKAINHNSSATPNVFPPLVQIGDCSWGYRILVRVGVESFQESQYGLFVALVQFRVVFG